MKNLRLALAALAIAATGTWSVYAIACDKNGRTSAANAVTASATRAAKGSCAAGAAAVTASAAECAAHGAKAALAAGCAGHDAQATAAPAAKAGCGSHDAASFSTASTGAACGAGKSAKSAAFTTASATGKPAKSAGAAGCCAAKDAKSARATTASAGECGAGAAMAGLGTCAGQAMNMAMCKDAHAGCDACEDMAAFEAELTGAGAAIQAVPIKNGVMFVYTASANGQVSAVQSAVARRSDHLNRIVTAGDQSRLCPGCKAMRGAMASGKVVREVVNIEGGSLALVTSNDAKLVRQIRAMADAGKTSARVKS